MVSSQDVSQATINVLHIDFHCKYQPVFHSGAAAVVNMLAFFPFLNTAF